MTSKLLSFFFLIYLFIYIYFWLCWVFVSVQGLSPAAASGGHSSSRCTGLSLLRPLLSRSTSSRRAGSAVVAHGPSRSAACGIFPDQGSNPCPLHWQEDSQPLSHQGSPKLLSNPKTLFLQQVFTNCLVCMPGMIPGDRDPAVNKTCNAHAVEKLTFKLRRQIINK